MLTHYLEQIFDALEKRGVATTAQIAQIEWSLFQLLDYRNRELRLHRVMAEDPTFYVSLMRAVFRAEDEEPVEPTPDEAARAITAYRLLSSFWYSRKRGDSLDVEHLRSWIFEVRRLGEKAGLQTMSDEFIGHVLAHAPADSGDGV